jgi:hypothetical protein
MDLSNPYIKLETVTAYNRLGGNETTSSMSKRNDSEGHHVVCAINGDFYASGGITISSEVVNGQFTHSVNGIRKGIAYSDEGKADILVPTLGGIVIADDDTSFHNLTAVNSSRYTDYLCLYNHYFGSSTETNTYGYECLANPISGWTINDTVYAVIEACEDGIGNMQIPAGKIVLSGHGTADSFLQSSCQVGDTVRIVQSMINSDLKNITQFVGGGPKMLQNGIDVTAQNTEGISASFYAVRHPRTAVGYNADSTLMYFVVVDGRKASSIGMTLHEMAAFMHAIGAEHAVNLDGGGSSTMVVRNSVKNDPSDGSERSVGNSMLCITSAPSGTFTHIQTLSDSIAVFKNKQISAGFTGWDEYYNPSGIPDWSQLTVSYDTSIGDFEENTFTAYENDGDTYVTADYNGEADSVKIHIIELYDLQVYPEAVTIDSVNGVNLEVRAVDESDVTSLYDNDIFEFTVLDPAVASVDTNGFVIGKTSGETKVIVRYGDQRDTVLVSVEIGEGEVVVDEIESIDSWTISGDTYINMSGTSMSLVDRTAGTGSKAVKVDYERTGSEDGMISIATDPVNIYGVPSYILVDVLADSQKNWIYIDLQDARGVDYSVKCSSSLRYKDDYRTQYLEMANLLPADGEQLYPLKITGIRLRIDDKATTGSMYIDRIRLIYPGWTAIDDPEVLIPGTHVLYQNYPNPFNPSTTIEYDLSKSSHVDLSVYDLKGEKVATLVNGIQVGGHHNISFDASLLPGGVYIYRLQASNWADTKKMLLIK